MSKELKTVISINGRIDKSLTAAFNRASSLAEKTLGSLGKGALSAVSKIGSAAAESAMAAGEAAASFAADSLKVGMELDSSMSQVMATWGYGADEINKAGSEAAQTYDIVKAKAQELGRTTQFTSSEAAEGFNVLAMAGYDAQKALETMPGLLDLAAAGGLDIAQAADHVTGIMAGFANEALNAGQVSDTLAVIASNAKGSVDDFGAGLATAAGMATATKQPMEDIAAVLGALGNANYAASEGGNMLNRTLKNLYQDKKKRAGLKKALGIDAFDEVTGAARPVVDVLKEIREATKDMTDAQLNTVLVDSFDAVTRKSLPTLLAAIDTPEFEQLQEALSNADGAAAKMASTMRDNLPGDIKMAESALKGFQEQIADRLMPTARKAVQFATQGLSRVTDALANGGIMAAAQEFGNWLNDGLYNIGNALPGITDKALTAISSLWDGLMIILPGVEDAAGAIVLQISESLTKELPEAFSTGLATVTILIQNVADALPDLMPKGAEMGLDLVLGLLDGIVENADRIVGSADALANSLTEGLENSVPIIEEKLPKILGKLTRAIVNLLTEGLKRGLKSLATNGIPGINLGQGIANAIGGSFGEEMSKEFKFDPSKGMLNAVDYSLAGAKAIGKSLIKANNGFNEGFYGKSLPGAESLEETKREADETAKALGGAAKESEKLAESLKKTAEVKKPEIDWGDIDVPEIEAPEIDWSDTELPELKTPEVDTAGIEKGSEAYNKIKEAIQEAATAAKNNVQAYKEVSQAARESASTWDIAKTAKQPKSTALDNKAAIGETELLKSAYRSVSTAAELMGRAVAAALSRIAEATGKGTESASKILDAFKQMKTGISTEVSSAAKEIENLFTQARSLLLAQNWESLGSDVVAGIERGVTNASPKLNQAIRNMSTGAVNASKTYFKIHSPSKLMEEEVGKHIPEGVAEGIIKGNKAISEAVGKLNKKTFDELKKSFGENIQKLSDSIKGKLDLFSKFDIGEAISADELIANMESQVNAVTEWSNKIAKLAARGTSQDILKKIGDMGPGGMRYADAFLSMSDEQLLKANNLFAQASQIPDTAAAQISASYAYAGSMAAEGFAGGLMADAVKSSKKAAEMGEAALSNLKAVLGIASPSKVTQDYGIYINQGLQKGLSDPASLAAISQAGKGVANTLTQAIKTIRPREMGANIVRELIAGMKSVSASGASKAAAPAEGFASGGTVESPTYALIGEAGYPETVVPHQETPRARALLAEAARGVYGADMGNRQDNRQFNVTINVNGAKEPKEVAREVMEKFRSFYAAMKAEDAREAFA